MARDGAIREVHVAECINLYAMLHVCSYTTIGERQTFLVVFSPLDLVADVIAAFHPTVRHVTT